MLSWVGGGTAGGTAATGPANVNHSMIAYQHGLFVGRIGLGTYPPRAHLALVARTYLQAVWHEVIRLPSCRRNITLGDALALHRSLNDNQAVCWIRRNPDFYRLPPLHAHDGRVILNKALAILETALSLPQCAVVRHSTFSDESSTALFGYSTKKRPGQSLKSLGCSHGCLFRKRKACLICAKTRQDGLPPFFSVWRLGVMTNQRNPHPNVIP